jgi:eukaryotic-like serine/threonine-protein kinase
MTLAAGARLGPYEVISPLGAGGMGEVYRAKDTRLDREVAVKVLSEHLSASDELRSRFEREAKAISSLSHPHICTLYDVGREGETDYLVMELLEGESLADRLEKGPLPLAEVLALGIQIADALEKAHGAGIVHRDLKPGNVFVTERGVKLLDFGLAKLHAAARQTSATQLGVLPTEQLSAPLTSAGMILGTFQYMSPEQLEGRESDARSDLFALGCVLYEMATGRKAFTGASQASLIGSIMHSSPPPVSSLATLSPPAFDRVIATCLEKDPKNRWHTAHDVKLQLQWIAEGGSQVGLPAPVVAHRKNRERLAWGAAALLALTTVALAVGFVRRAPVTAELVRFQVPQPAKLPVVGSPKLSPDGRYLAFNATDEQGTTRIWVRALNALEAQPLPGSEGTGRPFWSPDSRFLGFFADGKLKKIEVSGGPPQTICDAPTGADGSWGEDGTILYDGRGNDPIMKVAASGGVPVPLITGEGSNSGLQVGWPQFLPGGKRFLYVDLGGEGSGVRIADRDGGNSQSVVAGLSRVEYAPPGHLLFVREATLVAQPFDPATGQLSGEPVPVAEGLGTDAVGLADFSASRTGVLAYRAGQAGQGQFVWVDRKGARIEAASEPGNFTASALSPDGRWLAYQVNTGRGFDLWVRDLRRGVSSRFTFDEGNEVSPVFTRDGRRLVFTLAQPGQSSRIVSRALDRTGEDQVLLDDESIKSPSELTPDGRLLIYQSRASDATWDIWVLPVDGSGPARQFVASPFFNARPRLAPNGRWLAFQSDESGQAEIYVVAFPGPGGRWQISTSGGTEPLWSPDGRELFYLSPENRLMRVAVDSGPAFEASVPEPLFAVTLEQKTVRNRLLVSPDGERFLTLAPMGEQGAPPTTVILNWSRMLAR